MALFLLLSFFSCRKENALDCFKANGPDKTEARFPGNFSEVEVRDKIQLNIKPGPECRVELMGGRNILKNIKTFVEGERLVIDNTNTCNFVRGYKREIKVTVTLPYLRFHMNNGVGPSVIDPAFDQDTLLVRAENSGDIHINGRFNEIRTSSHGNGDIYLSGRCNTFYIYSYGTNFVHAENLRVSTMTFVHSQTLGDCTVSADSLAVLSCNIESKGNVYYTGKPGVIVDYSAEGIPGKLISR